MMTSVVASLFQFKFYILSKIDLDMNAFMFMGT